MQPRTPSQCAQQTGYRDPRPVLAGSGSELLVFVDTGRMRPFINI